MSIVAYLNGVFVPRDEARVSVDDGGYLHGAGLFETLRAEHGRVFRPEAHLARLMKSASNILGSLERSALPPAETLEELLRRNGLESARLRMTVSTAAAADAGAPRWTVCVTADSLTGYGEPAYRDGCRVMIARRMQPTDDPLAGHKTTCYLPRLLALRAAHTAHCTEALYFTPEHQLAEGTVSNVFIVGGGVLRTPPLHTPVLAGIARSVVLEAARDAGMEVDDQRAITIDDLLDADEAFLTNVIMQVLPVVRVEKRPVAEGRPGPVTAELLGAFRRTVQRECQGGMAE